MSVVRPLRSPSGTGGGSLTLEERVEALEQHLGKTFDMVTDLVDLVGKPANGPEGATGLHYMFAQLSEWRVEMDKTKERILGALSSGIPLASALGVVIWFAYGDKITALLKG